MFHTRAVVLSVRPCREHDEFVSFFTERSGKWIALARGTRKPRSKLAAMIHGLGMAQCSFVEGRQYPILTSLDSLPDCSIAQASEAPKSFYARYFLYAFLALCDDILYEEDRNDKLWKVVSGAVHAANITPHSERKEWLDIYDRWIDSLLESLGQSIAVEVRTDAGRTSAREIFANTYYKNPYPLEPFLLDVTP